MAPETDKKFSVDTVKLELFRFEAEALSKLEEEMENENCPMCEGNRVCHEDGKFGYEHKDHCLLNRIAEKAKKSSEQ